MADDYKTRWEALKEWVKSSRAYYQYGTFCSIAESVNGERNFTEILNKMKEIESADMEKLNELIGN